jgi:hypothetical protein
MVAYMPRYFFIVNGHATFDDEFGTCLADDTAAKVHARQIIQELKEGDDLADVDWTMTVKDDAGRELLTVPFHDVPDSDVCGVRLAEDESSI